MNGAPSLSVAATPEESSAAGFRPRQRATQPPAIVALTTHWPEYLMESVELGVFMVSACAFTVLLEHPASPAHRLLPHVVLRRALSGLAMAVTLLLLIHSAWGKRSGAHMNPAFTLMFLRLGKLELWDAVFYMVFQFIGGLTGVLISFVVIGRALAHPHVNFATTHPGMWGTRVAFMAEFLISFVMATTVLVVSNHKKLSRFTPFFAAPLIAAYITFEAPLSGMSMNPARTLGSAIPAHAFHALWIYFTAPPLATLLAAEIYVRLRSVQAVFCAKFHHRNSSRCIFRCRYAELRAN